MRRMLLRVCAPVAFAGKLGRRTAATDRARFAFAAQLIAGKLFLLTKRDCVHIRCIFFRAVVGPRAFEHLGGKP